MDIKYYRMDIPTLRKFLSPILTVPLVWSTGETGEIGNRGKFISSPIFIRCSVGAEIFDNSMMHILTRKWVLAHLKSASDL